MIVSFFGHSDFIPNESIKSCLSEILNDVVGNSDVEFYLGGYGGFDAFARKCCLEFKKNHKAARIILVTPYISLSKSLEAFSKECDEILYPSLEEVPPRYAISERNKWMVRKADTVIAYINRTWGGAYAACKYCVTKGKKLMNLGSLCFQK